MKKPLKSIVLILVTAIIMFVVPVSADMIARPEIINPETDFSLNNPEAKKTVTALAYDCDGEIIGPFNYYYAHEDGRLELRFADYYAPCSNGYIKLITLIKSSVNSDIGGQAFFIKSTDKRYISENHITIGNEAETYIVTATGTAPSQYTLPFVEKSTPAQLQAVNAAVKRSAKYLIMNSSPQRIVIDSKSELSTTASSDSSTGGSPLPLVAMTFNENGKITSYACYASCIASIVKYREPINYSDVTPKQVATSGANRFKYFNKSNLVTIEQMQDVLSLDYLSKIGSHYSTSFGITNKAMSQTSYKSIIDNGCVMLGIFRNPDDKSIMHALGLSQYKTVNGVVIARGMDPMNVDEDASEEENEELGYIDMKWVNGWLYYKFGSTDTNLYDHVTSYY